MTTKRGVEAGKGRLVKRIRKGFEERVRLHPDVTEAAEAEAEPLLRPEEPAEELMAAVPSPLEDVSLTSSFHTYRPSFEEIFDYLGHNFAPALASKAEGVQSLGVEIVLSPDEARRGGRVEVAVPAEIPCPSCHAQAVLGRETCLRCRGEGSLRGEFPVAIEIPPGMVDGHAAEVSLEHLGVHNCYLTVSFRIDPELR
jgi:hypothetical protein